jgi:hypothetical protein
MAADVRAVTYLNQVAELLTLLALRKAPSNFLRLSPLTGSIKLDGSLLESLQRQDVVKGRRYWHPLLGLGWATAVESQEVGRPTPKVA